MAISVKKKSKEQVKITSSFLWSGVNRKGQTVSGEIKAENISLAKADLIRQGLIIKKIKKQNEIGRAHV